MIFARSFMCNVSDPMVGDTIDFRLDGLGIFSATVQKACADRVIFMVDECVMEAEMLTETFNLPLWLNTDFKQKFPEWLRKEIIYIALPTYGQIFGHDDFYEKNIFKDYDSQFPLMANARNRAGIYKNNFYPYWIRNRVETSSTSFALVDADGDAYYNGASFSIGVRPVFAVKKNG